MICEVETTADPRAEITDAAFALKFMWGGNARVTLQSRATGTRFTFRVLKDKKDRYNVSVLTGSDNETDYKGFGYINASDGEFRFSLPAYAQISREAPSAAAFAWAYPRIKAGQIPAQLSFWHEGRCMRCAKALTDPVSIAAGLGPECRKKG